jgi:hypothetical protein
MAKLLKKKTILQYLLLTVLVSMSVVIGFDIKTQIMGMQQWVEILVFEFTLQTYYTQYISK